MARCFSHDYRSRCIYHITLKKAPGVEAFGHLCGEYPDCGIARSRLGEVIEKRIRQLPSFDPALKVLQYSIMPDHVHLLLFVTAPTKWQLGNYMGMLKVSIHQDYKTATGCELTAFEDDFYDCILYPYRSLDVIYRYIRENPRRLAVRKAHPEFFRRINSLTIGERQYQAFGNYQLMDCPFKEQVVVHRADSPQTRLDNRERWIYTASNGGVLVSPFISKDEKAIRAEGEASGGRLILITAPIMEERFKLSGRDFELCESGRMLIISAGCGSDLSRRSCLTMNSLAATICSR